LSCKDIDCGGIVVDIPIAFRCRNGYRYQVRITNGHISYANQQIKLAIPQEIQIARKLPGNADIIRRGDLILEVDRDPVKSAQDLTRRLGKRDKVLVLVKRGDSTLWVPLRKQG